MADYAIRYPARTTLVGATTEQKIALAGYAYHHAPAKDAHAVGVKAMHVRTFDRNHAGRNLDRGGTRHNEGEPDVWGNGR